MLQNAVCMTSITKFMIVAYDLLEKEISIIFL